MDKVVSIYNANELRNKSLFKFVTEDTVGQTEALKAEVEELEALAEKLEKEQHAQDAADALSAAQRIEESEAEESLTHRLEVASDAVAAILPLLEKLGIFTMAEAQIAMPQHLELKGLGPPSVPEFLALLEDSLGANPHVRRASQARRADLRDELGPLSVAAAPW